MEFTKYLKIREKLSNFKTKAIKILIEVSKIYVMNISEQFQDDL